MHLECEARCHRIVINNEAEILVSTDVPSAVIFRIRSGDSYISAQITPEKAVEIASALLTAYAKVKGTG